MKNSMLLKLIKIIFNKKQNIDYKKKIIGDNIEYNFININTNLISRAFLDFSKESSKKISNEINIEKYDLIHAHWLYPYGYIAQNISKKNKNPLCGNNTW